MSRIQRFSQLALFITSRGWNVTDGMNWLQDRGWISDECVNVEDVAPVDAERIFRAAGALWCIPKSER